MDVSGNPWRTVAAVLLVFAAPMAIAATPGSSSTTGAAPSGSGVTFANDDGGSGQDAGDTIDEALPIQTGVAYSGAVVTGGDNDWYSFEARAGQEIAVAYNGDEDVLGPCALLFGPDGTRLGLDCADGTHAMATLDGTHFLEIQGELYNRAGANYRFTVAVDDTPYGSFWFGSPGDGERVRHDGREAPGQVVVAAADTGVNPYHRIYHRPSYTEHPCTWVEGFDDCDIPALDLSIGVYDTVEEALEADADVWAQAEFGQWYWIPGTNIIGAYCDPGTNAREIAEGGADELCIFDENGHGTGVTSSVLSEHPDTLLLVHDGNSGAYGLETAPVVPDVQSHSWGPPAPVPLHAADATGVMPLAERGAFDPETLFFIGAGNEAPFPTILDVSRVHPSVQVVGGGAPGHWTAQSWTTYDFASWFCRPTATHDSVLAVRGSFCGTSFAAPTAAGTAAAAISALRHRAGSNARSTVDEVAPGVTRDAFVEALRRAASYDVTLDDARFPNLPWNSYVPLTPGAEWLHWGYGWLDATRTDVVVACALDADDPGCPVMSHDARSWNDARQQARRTTTGT